MKRRDFFRTIALASTPGFAGSLYAGMQGNSEQRHGDLLIQSKTTDHFELRFTPNNSRPLRLLQLADTHFHPGDGTNSATAGLLQKLVENEKPDLVIHTGDFVNNDSDKPVNWEGMDILNELHVPWTLCFGNHDYPVRNAQGSLSLDEIRTRMERGLQGFVDDSSGRHYCYRYDVLRADQNKPDACLFFFQVGYAEGDRRISDAQVAWFNRQMQSDMDRGVSAPVTVFVHIPLIEYQHLYESGAAKGQRGEDVCFDSDTGESFRSFSISRRVVGVFCGHDHVNNYHGDWKGVDLAYGRVSGWGGYGPADWSRGGRLITFDLESTRPLPVHREIF